MELSALAWGAPSQATHPSDPNGGQATGTKVTLEPEGPLQPQACPATLRFRGTVTAASSGIVRFRFRFNRDTTTPSIRRAITELTVPARVPY